MPPPHYSNEVYHLIIVIIVLAIAIILLGTGRGLGGLARRLIMGKSSDDRCSLDPSLCPDHKAEKERSKRNEQEIKELWNKYGDLHKMILDEVGDMKKTVGGGIAKLHANQLKLMVALIETRPELKKHLAISADVLNLENEGKE